MTKVIVFANQKGGVAKTTTAIALAQSLALDGKKVLFFDLDPQENASNTLRLKQDVPNLYDLMTAPDGDMSVFDACLQSVEGCKNITAIRGNIQLSAADLMFNRQGREFIIKERLEAHKSKFDVVIMDTPPALGVLTVNALTSANTVVVPISPDGYSLQGFYQLNENIRLIKKYSNPQLKIGGILVTRYVPNTIVSREIKEIAQEYAEMAGTKVYKSVIRQTVLVSESISAQQGVVLFAPNSTAAQDYRAFAREIKREELMKGGIEYAFCTLTIGGKDIPVRYGVDGKTLEKSPGYLPSSALPGAEGTCAIYGHRNRNHFKVLKGAEVGDSIKVTMADGTVYTYAITDITIYESTSEWTLPASDGKMLVLVTCYPFQYSGHAPGKCVVTAKLK